jgi:hypothetical protein
VESRILFEGIDHGVEVGGVNVVIDIAVGVGNAGVFRTEPPLAVHNELVLMEPSGQLLREKKPTIVMEN